MTTPFFDGFNDELCKLAVDPKVTSWAVSRGLTAGLAAGLMGATLTSVGNRSRPRSQRRDPFKMGLTTASIGALTGLGKGFLEKGVERRVLKALTKR